MIVHVPRSERFTHGVSLRTRQSRPEIDKGLSIEAREKCCQRFGLALCRVHQFSALVFLVDVRLTMFSTIRPNCIMT